MAAIDLSDPSVQVRVSRGGDDPDGDGKTNLQEYLAGTNPLDPTSGFRITNIEIIGADVQVSWITVTGKNYQLQRADSPDSSGIWINIGDPMAGNGNILSQIDSGAAGEMPHYYRVAIP